MKEGKKKERKRLYRLKNKRMKITIKKKRATKQGKERKEKRKQRTKEGMRGGKKSTNKLGSARN